MDGIPGGVLRIAQTANVPHPAGAANGTPGYGNSLVEILPTPPLAPGRYKWQVSFDGETREDWEAWFVVMPEPKLPVIGGTPQG
ncbi:MAG: hypothetical protein M0Z34_07570 [Nitrospiraceae bacterium]|nr:hypothetical protein [Nitrospiraceae bacterium]